MTILSRTLLAGVAAAIAGCSTKRPYIPAGADPPLDVAGIYATQENLQSTSCRGITPQDSRTKVEHSPGATSLKILNNDRPFDGTIRPDGNFTTIPSALPSGRGSATTTITGRFTETGFYARVYVRVDFPTVCDYELRWTGTRL